MYKNELFDADSVRKVLIRDIREHIDDERLADAVRLPRAVRNDAISCIVRDAVSGANIATFSGIPHVYIPSLGYYQPFEQYDLQLAVYDAMRKAGVPDGCYGGLSALIKLCWAEVKTRRTDIDTSVVVMDNGVFDTMDLSLHRKTAKYHTNMKVGFEYNANMVASEWIKFLDRVLPDPEQQLLLQEFLAMCYVDRQYVKLEHMLILLGKGSNGKSVVFEVVMSLLGEDNVTNFSIGDMINAAKREQTIASINGKRLNYCSEIRTTEIGAANSDAFKALVSGESQMARSLYCEPFKATKIPVIMANANKLPQLGDTSLALARRILILPFNVTIPEKEQDKELAARLKAELPGIFNWVMEGFMMLRDRGYQLDIPYSVRKEVNQYFKDNDSVTAWAEDSCFSPIAINGRDEDFGWKSRSDLYSLYRAWAEDSGESVVIKKAFFSKMSDIGYECSRMASGYMYKVYRVPSEDEIQKVNMDLAIAMQRQELFDQLREKLADKEVLRVRGVEDTELYLGLPKDTLWPIYKNGLLEDAVVYRSNIPEFDIRMVQMILAKRGYYERINKGKNAVIDLANASLRGMRKSFNARMRTMGIPIRKYGSSRTYIKITDRDCWFVPDDWEYTERGAASVISKDRDTYNSINNIDKISKDYGEQE